MEKNEQPTAAAANRTHRRKTHSQRPGDAIHTASSTTYRRLYECTPAQRQQLAAVMACYEDEDRYEEFLVWLAEEFLSLNHSRRAYLVAEESSRIVGFVRLWHTPHIDEWVLDGIVVATDFRRRGIGRELVRRTLALAREMGADSVVVHVSRKNPPAISLYEQAGFCREADDYRNSHGQWRRGVGWLCRADVSGRHRTHSIEEKGG
jgi:ribosomal protein S18 acetylase RimI-like enzyme